MAAVNTRLRVNEITKRTSGSHSDKNNPILIPQAAELLAKAFAASGEGLVELRKIEAAEEIAANLSKSRNVVYLPSGQQTLLSLPQ